jgi:hypothetical protein
MRMRATYRWPRDPGAADVTLELMIGPFDVEFELMRCPAVDSSEEWFSSATEESVAISHT